MTIMKYTFTQLISGTDFNILVCSLAALFLVGVGCSAKKDTGPQLEQIPKRSMEIIIDFPSI